MEVSRRNNLFILLVIVGVIAGGALIYRCSSSPDQGQGRQNVDPLQTLNEWVQLTGETMGAPYKVIYQDPDKHNYQPALDSLFGDFNRALSTYQDSSEISRFNSGAYDTLESRYWQVVLQKSQKLYQESEGAFDPTVFPVVDAWGFFRKHGHRKPDSAQIDSLLKNVGFGQIQFDAESIRKTNPNVALDFNALAPGYLADVAAEYLEKQGIENYFVNVGGGEIRCKGHRKTGEEWRIGIVDPAYETDRNKRPKRIVTLGTGALATSGNYESYFVQDGKKYSHVIDPRTGYPAMNRLLSVTVIAEDCISADALATLFLVWGREKSKAYARQHPEIDYFFIYDADSLKSEASPGFQSRIYQPENA